MKHPEFDKDGYLTEETLAYIENYKNYLNPVPLIEFILKAWTYPDYTVWDPPILELHTAGWSGNERIIRALRIQSIFWFLYWQKSERGGHYYFKIDLEDN